MYPKTTAVTLNCCRIFSCQKGTSPCGLKNHGVHENEASSRRQQKQVVFFFFLSFKKIFVTD
jgi:hypothetical protein